ncbi:class D sortase [Lentisalinibacter orientalis]|uniref:class D sortase n=1 Tax=Lentisalinibacter orientalis TaxID=2992241 RepID=UPI0038692B18
MKILETLLWVAGVTLLSSYVGALYWGEQQRQEGLASFATATATAQQPAPEQWLVPPPANEPRPREIPLTAAAAPVPDAVIAVLRIPGIALEVPVYEGTTADVLRRGAGLVEGTAFPGSTGNVGIAAHRDTHFRALKDVAVGDLVELNTPEKTRFYRITALEVVDPGDVHVLDDTGESMLTLVTCYPFYFVGNAPQRFIVHAVVTMPSGFL